MLPPSCISIAELCKYIKGFKRKGARLLGETSIIMRSFEASLENAVL